jgi:hypothetical protein
VLAQSVCDFGQRKSYSNWQTLGDKSDWQIADEKKMERVIEENFTHDRNDIDKKR